MESIVLGLSLTVVVYHSARTHLAKRSFVRPSPSILLLARMLAISLLVIYQLSTHKSPYVTVLLFINSVTLFLLHIQICQLIFTIVSSLAWYTFFELLLAHFWLQHSISAWSWALSVFMLLSPILRIFIGNNWQVGSLSFSLLSFLSLTNYFWFAYFPICKHIHTVLLLHESLCSFPVPNMINFLTGDGTVRLMGLFLAFGIHMTLYCLQNLALRIFYYDIEIDKSNDLDSFDLKKLIIADIGDLSRLFNSIEVDIQKIRSQLFPTFSKDCFENKVEWTTGLPLGKADSHDDGKSLGLSSAHGKSRVMNTDSQKNGHTGDVHGKAADGDCDISEADAMLLIHKGLLNSRTRRAT